MMSRCLLMKWKLTSILSLFVWCIHRSTQSFHIQVNKDNLWLTTLAAQFIQPSGWYLEGGFSDPGLCVTRDMGGHSIACQWNPMSSPLTHIVYLLPCGLFNWLQKRFRLCIRPAQIRRQLALIGWQKQRLLFCSIRNITPISRINSKLT